MAALWQLRGSSVAICGSFVAALWQFCGYFVAALWQFCGYFVAVARQLCGSTVALSWQLCGSAVAILWQFSGSFPAVLWLFCWMSGEAGSECGEVHLPFLFKQHRLGAWSHLRSLAKEYLSWIYDLPYRLANARDPGIMTLLRDQYLQSDQIRRHRVCDVFSIWHHMVVCMLW